MPLRDVALVGAKGDLRVDRGRPPDAATGDEGVTTSPFGRGAKRSGQKRSCAAFASQREVGSTEMRPALEEQHVATTLRQFARDHRAGAGAHHHDVELALHAIPRYDQSFARRVASGELKSISAHAPGPSFPGATKSE